MMHVLPQFPQQSRQLLHLITVAITRTRICLSNFSLQYESQHSPSAVQQMGLVLSCDLDPWVLIHCLFGDPIPKARSHCVKKICHISLTVFLTHNQGQRKCLSQLSMSKLRSLGFKSQLGIQNLLQERKVLPKEKRGKTCNVYFSPIGNKPSLQNV